MKTLITSCLSQNVIIWLQKKLKIVHDLCIKLLWCFFFNGAFSNRTNPVQFKQLKFDLLCFIKHKSYDFKKNCSAFVKCICRKHKYHRTLFIATKHILLWHFFPYCILLNHKSYMKASVSTLDSVYSHSNQILKQKLRFAG